MHKPIGELGGGPKQPYGDTDDCEHDFDEDEDACEFVCILCGHREPIPLDKLMK